VTDDHRTTTLRLDDDLEAAARAMLDAHDAMDRARILRDKALAAYVVAAGMSAPATAVHARTTLVGRHLSEDQIRLVGVSEQTVRPAARHARALLAS
jgi:hypothetical protein